MKQPPIQNRPSHIERVALIGTGPHAEARAEAVRAAEGAALAEHLPEATAAGVIQRREAALDVALVCGTPGRRRETAEAALRQGRHLFLEWPPAASAKEAERLAARAEEAGAEVGVSRPLRFHPLFDAWPAGGTVTAASVQQEVAAERGSEAPSGFRAPMADALDLGVALAAGSESNASVTRLDTQATRSGQGARFEAVLAGLRFASGAYVQVGVRRCLAGGAPRRRLWAAGPGGLHLDAALDAPGVHVRRDGARNGPRGKASASNDALADDGAFPEALLRRETRAFLEALQAGRPAPVSLLDALAVMRLAERLVQQVR